MQSQLYSISKLFSERLFRIPDYQRGYAWNNRQLKEFWNDIIQLGNGKNHYCGVLTLEPVFKKVYKQWLGDLWIIDSKSYEPFFVVDGQQRLTTTIILLQSIIEIVPNGTNLNFTDLDKIKEKFIFETRDGGISRSYIFGYETDNPSYEFLKTEIFGENSSSDYTGERTIYTHNLRKAKDYFLDQMKGFTLPQIETIYKKITQHLLFNIYTITNDIDVFVAFETMNNRGKPLSNLELLKNRLIYLTTKMETDEHEKQAIRKIINDSWRAVYHYLGKNELYPLSDDIFLANHFATYVYADYIQGDIIDRRIFSNYYYYRDRDYAYYLFDEKFSSRRLYDVNGKLTISEIKNYADSLRNSIMTWYYIHFPDESPYFKDEKEILGRISRLDDNSKLPLLLSIYNKRNRKIERMAILEALEQLLFIKTLVYSYDTPLNANLLNIASMYSHGEINASEVLDLLTQDVKLYLKGQKFIQDVKRRFSESNFYRWDGIRYFMYEYERSLFKRTKNKSPKILWNEFNAQYEDYISIEHIYPQKPIHDYWKEKFNDYGLKEKRRFQNSLGNLLALAKPKNSSLQNKPFHEKIESGDNYIGYRYGSYSEIEVSKYEDWGPEAILERGIILLKFVEANWKIKLGSDADKVKLLGLDFIKK